LAAAIRELLEKRERRAQLSQLGRKRIEETFSWEVAAKQFTAYYHKILNQDKQTETTAPIEAFSDVVGAINAKKV